MILRTDRRLSRSKSNGKTANLSTRRRRACGRCLRRARKRFRFGESYHGLPVLLPVHGCRSRQTMLATAANSSALSCNTGTKLERRRSLSRLVNLHPPRACLPRGKKIALESRGHRRVTTLRAPEPARTINKVSRRKRPLFLTLAYDIQGKIIQLFHRSEYQLYSLPS
jgi:hypothetical protein